MDPPYDPYLLSLSRAEARTWLWLPHQWSSPEPTKDEYELVGKFLRLFPVERPDFNEEADPAWVKFKATVGGGDSLRDDVLKLLHQIRRSKGYDVDVFVDFRKFNYWSNFGVFTPKDLTVHYDLAKAATDFAIEARNIYAKVFMNRDQHSFKLVSVDRMVSAYKHRYCKILLLLSFTAEETDARKVRTTSFQAMVNPGKKFTFENGVPPSFNLIEWKPNPHDLRRLKWFPKPK